MHKKIIILALLVANTLIVSAKDYYPQSQRPDHLLFHITPAVSLLNYSSVDGRSLPTPSVGFGMEYAHFFHRRLGLSVGAEFNSYGSLYLFNGRKDSLQLFDSWSNRNYKLRQQLYSKEYQRVSYLSIPVKAIFRQKLSQTMNINVSAGVAYNVYMSESKSIIAGTIKRQAYFGDIHVDVDDFLPLMFGTFTDYINPSNKPQFSKTLTAVAQIGLTYQLSTRWTLHTDINYQYGTKNIKTRTINILEPNEYAGVTATNYIGSIKPYSLGLRIGISYNFDLFNADCHCQSSWWK
jgi:outer membrane protein W